MGYVAGMSQAAGASRIARTTEPAAPTIVAVVPRAAARMVTGGYSTGRGP